MGESETKLNEIEETTLSCALPPFSRKQPIRFGAKITDQLNWSKELPGLLELRRNSDRGKWVRVALLDTGVCKHPDLAISEQYNDCPEDFKSFVSENVLEDSNGHGTHCAGIIAGQRDGIAPNVKLIVGRVLDQIGRGTVSALVKGIKWAAEEKKADIISISISNVESTPKLYEAIHLALSQGVCIICAAGNMGFFHMGYPARYGGVITVGSHDRWGKPSKFSSQGGELDFLAPGQGIWSTWLPTNIDGSLRDDTYACLSGTSMAAPFVAGIAALIIARAKKADVDSGRVSMELVSQGRLPDFSNETLKRHLLEMASHPMTHNQRDGYGPLLPFQYFFQ